VWVATGGERALVTERLVGDGAIEARSYPPDTRHDDRLDAAEREARSDRAGIWGRC
jgi:endonuclease YncB( thermonuclease family)